jgi:DNA topoisomerase IB
MIRLTTLLSIATIILSFNTKASTSDYEICLQVLDMKVDLHKVKNKYQVSEQEMLENTPLNKDNEVFIRALYEEVFSTQVNDIEEFKRKGVYDCYDKHQRKFDI